MNARTVLWSLAGAVALVAAIVIGWSLFGSDDEEAAPPQGGETGSSTQSPNPATGGSPGDADAGESADGCLGGPDPQTAVLKAQQEAPLNAKGAAELSASMSRFIGFAPRSDNAQDMSIVKKVSGGPTRARTLKTGWVSKVPDERVIRLWTDTKSARYRIVSATPDKVVLDDWIVVHLQGDDTSTVKRWTGGRQEYRSTDGKHWVLWSSRQTPDFHAVIKNKFRGTQAYAGGC